MFCWLLEYIYNLLEYKPGRTPRWSGYHCLCIVSSAIQSCINAAHWVSAYTIQQLFISVSHCHVQSRTKISNQVLSWLHHNWPILTRKLCYRKDDRTMRPIYGCPEIFGDFLTTPTATFPSFSWAFVLIHPMSVRTKFKVRSFTRSRDNRGTQKIWEVPGYAHAPSSPKFLNGL